MFLAAIASSALSQLANIHRKPPQPRSEFKQPGQDVHSGSSTKAQSDVVNLSRSATSQPGSNTATAKILNTLGQAIHSGDLAAARKAFFSLPGAVVGPCAVPHSSHVPPMQSTLSRAFGQLGKALQSGDLSAAQQAFSAVQQGRSQMLASALSIGQTTSEITSAMSVNT